MNFPDLQKLTDWLIDGARSATTPTRMMSETCERLVQAGLPLWRVGVFIRMLHPDVFGRGFFWRPGAEVVVTSADFDIQDSPEYRSSPLAILYDTEQEVRFRLDDPASRGFPFFDDLRAEGVTDYIALPLWFVGEMHASSWSTKQPGGFSDRQLDVLRSLVPPLARVIEIISLSRKAATLLDTYVGNRAGERILGGQIRRGHTETMHAAIWLSDLRGFTALSDRLAPEIVVEILNRYFDCQVPAIRTHGGEILKFMGDGLLAVFPIAEDESNIAEVCGRVLQAARESRASVEAMQLRQWRNRRAFPLRGRVACRQDPVRQYRRRQPARLHLYRSGGQSRRPAGKDRRPPQPHRGRLGAVCRDLRQRLDRSRRVSDRRLCKGRAGLRPGRRNRAED